jgi:hypothetical protein
MVGSVKQSAPQIPQKKDTYAGAFDPKLNKIVQVEIKNIGKGADGQDNFAIKTKNGKMIPLNGIHNQADAKKQAQMQINGGELFRAMGQGYAWGAENFSEDLAKQVKEQFLASRPQSAPVENINNQSDAQKPNPSPESSDAPKPKDKKESKPVAPDIQNKQQKNTETNASSTGNEERRKAEQQQRKEYNDYFYEKQSHINNMFYKD